MSNYITNSDYPHVTALFKNEKTMQQRIASRLRNVKAGVSDEGRKSDMNGGAYSSGRIGGKIAFAKYLVADLSTAVHSAEEQKNVSKERWNEKLETYQKKEKIVTKIARDIKNAKSALEKAEGKYYKCETERKRVEEQNRQDEEEDDDEEGKYYKRRERANVSCNYRWSDFY